MNNLETLQRVLEHIDSHIKADLDVQALAAVAGFSPYHFCRVFLWGVGHPAMEYVRGRRLAFAAAELGSGRRIIDIAMDYGFETHSGFSKAFRRHFGCTPEAYRMHAHFTLPSLPSLARMEHYLIGGIVMEPKFVTRPVTRIAGYVLKTRTVDKENMAAIPAFWSAYLSDGRSKKLHGEAFMDSHDEYGACFPENQETGEFEYMIGVAVKQGATPEGYDVREIPAATYAVFSTPPCVDADFSSTIQGTWQYIFNEWFPASGYEFAMGAIDYELYRDCNVGESGNVCEIYIPVVKKQG